MIKRIVSGLVAMLIVLSSVTVITVFADGKQGSSGGTQAVTDTRTLLENAAVAYLNKYGNNATADGLKTAVSVIYANAAVESFYIKPAVNGARDDSTDYPLSIPARDGYAAAVISAGEIKLGVNEAIIAAEENLGELTTEIYSADNKNFTTSSKGYITAYKGSAEKIVIPQSFSSRIAFSGTNNTVEAIVIGSPDGEMTVEIAKNSFKAFSALVAIQLPGKVNGRFATGAFANCKNLKYVALPHEIYMAGAKFTVGNEAFKGCSLLETACCSCCGKMPKAVYQDNVFTGTAIRSYYLPDEISLSGNAKEITDVFGVSPSYEDGEALIVTAEEQKKADIARAAALAAEKAYGYGFSESDTADTVKSVITSAYNTLEGAENFTADWKNTFKKNGKKASGTLYISDGSVEMPVEFYYNEDAGLISLNIGGYALEPTFDPATANYTLQVPYTVESLNITARRAYGAKLVSVSGGEALTVGSGNIIKIDTLSKSGKSVKYTVTVKRLENKTELNAAVLSAFYDYIDKTGNNTDINGVVNAVNAAIAPASVTVDENEFFILHAQDGVCDDDPDEATRLSIPGRDGYVSAVFRVSENSKTVSIVGGVRKITHTTVNLGVLTKSEDTDFVLDENGNLINYTGDAEKVIIPSSVKNIKSTGAKENAGLKKALVLITKNSGYTIEASAFRSAKDGSYGWVSLIAADLSNNKLFKERAFSGLPSLKYLKLPTTGVANGSAQYFDYAAFADNEKLETVNIPSSISLLGNVFNNTAVRDFYEGRDLHRPRADKFEDYGSPSFSVGTRVVMTYSEQQKASFARAAVLAQQAADGITVSSGDTADAVADKITAAYESLNDEVAASWNGSFKNNGDKLNGTLTLSFGDARFEINFNRDNGNALRDMYVTDYTLLPEFNAETHEYTVTVKNSITALALVTVTAPGAEVVAIDGNSNFSVGGNNTVTVKAKAANGDVLEYTINVTRSAPKTFDEMVADIKTAVNAAVFSNNSTQADLQKAINTATKGEPFSADITDFYLYKAIGGATENGTEVLVEGHNGYITAVVNVSGAGETKEIAVKTVIKPEMEDFTFATVSTEDDFVLSDDGKTLLSYEGTAEKIVFPDGIEKIDELYMYSDTTGIRCVILPESLRVIPASLCYNMTDLEVAVMRDNVVKSGAGTFMNCVSLKHVRLSESLEVLPSTMFSHTISLGQIYLPQAVTSVGDNTFYRSLVREITLSENVTVIGGNAFSWGINNATYFVSASLGALFTSERAQELQKNVVSKWAYKNGVNVPRTITVLGKNVEIDATAFAGDTTGAWATNIVRYVEGSTVQAYLASQSSTGSMAPAKENATVLSMSLCEAAARAQIAADSLAVSANATDGEVKQIISASYLSEYVTSLDYSREYAVSGSSISAELALTGENGAVFDIEVNTTVFNKAAPISESNDDDTDSDFRFDYDYGDNTSDGNQNGYNDNQNTVSNADTDENTEQAMKTLRRKVRKKIRIPGTEISYIPWMWIIIVSAGVLCIGGGLFTFILIKHKKNKSDRN